MIVTGAYGAYPVNAQDTHSLEASRVVTVNPPGSDIEPAATAGGWSRTTDTSSIPQAEGRLHAMKLMVGGVPLLSVVNVWVNCAHGSTPTLVTESYVTAPPTTFDTTTLNAFGVPPNGSSIQ